jgi:hypothetical protein
VPASKRTTHQPLKAITDHRGDGTISRKENGAWQKEKSPGHPKLRLRYTGERKA